MSKRHAGVFFVTINTMTKRHKLSNLPAFAALTALVILLGLYFFDQNQNFLTRGLNYYILLFAAILSGLGIISSRTTAIKNLSIILFIFAVICALGQYFLGNLMEGYHF